MGISSEIVGSLLLLLAPIQTDVAAATWQNQTAPPLERFQTHLGDIIDHQAAYACHASIERSARLSAKGKPVARDRVRLELAATGPTELYSWPESGAFEKGEIEQIALGEAGGMNGVTGWFRTMLAATGVASSGDCTAQGRRGLKFEFQVPWTSSSYHLILGTRRIAVPYNASLCVDASTLDPIQIEVNATPASGPVASVHETIFYRQTRIGTNDTLTPVARELTVTDREGGIRSNTAEFSGFRPYTKQDTASRAEAKAVPIPAGTEIDLKLDTPISFEQSSVGDPVTAHLQKAIRVGSLDIQKGTEIIGRIGRIEERFQPEHHYVVGLDLLAAKTDGGEVRFRARLTGPKLKFDRRPESVAGFGDPQFMPPIWDPRGLEIDDTDPAARFGVFRVRGTKLKIAAGLHMIWQTMETKPAGALPASSNPKP